MPALTKKQHDLFVRVNNMLTDHLQFIGAAILCTKGGEPQEIGSGTCIEIDGRHFIATAEHVLEHYSDDELLLVTELDGQDWTPAIVGRGVDKRLDVAWLELAPGVEKHLSRRFITLDRIRTECNALPSDVTAVYGFPNKLVEYIPGSRRIFVQPLCFASGTLDGASLSSTYASDEDIYLSYPQEDLSGPDGTPVKGIEALGLSGGGIWAFDVNKSGVWTPESAQLIGIQYAWLRWEWVRGTQIQHWLALVARDLPELGPTIARTIDRTTAVEP